MATPEPEGPKRTVKVKQACDCCHARKIRCDGDKPCANCIATELHCTYLAVPKKKGPKGKRLGKMSINTGKTRIANVLHSLSKPARPDVSPPQNLESHLANLSTSTPDSSPIPSISAPQPSPSSSSINPDVIEQRKGVFQRSSLLSDDLIRACVDAFFTHKYPIMPILDREETYGLIPHLESFPEQYSLITALCAMIVLQPEILDPTFLATPGLKIPSSEVLIKEANRARRFCDHVENPSLAHVQTSFFFFAALFSLGKDKSAWFYIRESMTMLQLQRLHEETTYPTMTNPLCKIYCRRTFWLLFITERAYALQRHQPLTLQRTIDLPTVDPGPESTILSGFLDLVSLFQNFDDNFLSLWNLSGSGHLASPQSLIQLQDILKFAIPNVSERTEIQQADLLVSKQWLKTMVWQLCVSKGLLSSASTNESMSFHYPVTIAREVVAVSRLLPHKAFEANGVGILEKVFDIGCSLSDVLQLHPSFIHSSGLEIGPRDYLMEFVRILGTAAGGNKYLRLLSEKAEDFLQVNLRGSLSESEASDRIEEMEDDEDVEFENSHVQDPEPKTFDYINVEFENSGLQDNDPKAFDHINTEFENSGLQEPKAFDHINVEFENNGLQDNDPKTFDHIMHQSVLQWSQDDEATSPKVRDFAPSEFYREMQFSEGATEPCFSFSMPMPELPRFVESDMIGFYES